MNQLDAILIGLAFGHEPPDVRAEVAQFLASQSAFARGVANVLARSPGPRWRRAAA